MFNVLDGSHGTIMQHLAFNHGYHQGLKAAMLQWQLKHLLVEKDEHIMREEHRKREN